jgi:hypothetical protein
MLKKRLLLPAAFMILMLVIPKFSSATGSDENLLQFAQQQLRAYLEERQTATNWKIEIDPINKIIKTNWYNEHKGEIIQKDEIAVHKGLIRVDVWQKTGWIFQSEQKTDWSRRAEWAIQERLERAKSQLN